MKIFGSLHFMLGDTGKACSISKFGQSVTIISRSIGIFEEAIKSIKSSFIYHVSIRQLSTVTVTSTISMIPCG